MGEVNLLCNPYLPFLLKFLIAANSNMGTLSGQLAFESSTSQVSSGMPSMEIVPLTGRPIGEKKASVYAEVMKKLNKARESGSPFKVRPLLSPSLKFIIRFLYQIEIYIVSPV